MDRETQRIVAWHTHISWQAPERTIYMDGRPHPPEWAPHTWQGFSTGRWVGDILEVTTSHLKIGWIRRNGIPRSEQATLTEYWIRHDDGLTLIGKYQSVLAGQQMKESAERMDSGLSFALAGEERRGRDLFNENDPVFQESLRKELHNITLPGEGELANKVKEA